MAVLCGVCSVKMSRNSDHLQCSECAACFHLDCGDIDIAKYLEMREDRSLKSWRCKGCNKVPSDHVNNTSGGGALQSLELDNQPSLNLNQEEVARKSLEDISCLGRSKIDQVLVNQMQIIEFLDSTQKCIQSIKDENFKLKEAVQDNRELINDLREQISCLQSEIMLMRQRAHPNHETQKSLKAKNTRSTALVPLSIESNDTGTPTGAINAINKAPHSKKLLTASRENGLIDKTTSLCPTQTTSMARSLQNAVSRPVSEVNQVNSGAKANGGVAVRIGAVGPVTRRAPAAAAAGARGNQDIVRGTAPTPAVAVGSTRDTFAAVARRAYLYVGNINPNTSRDTVANYIRSKQPNCNFVIDELPKRDGALSRAYKLTVDFSMLETYSQPDFWPEGVVIKRFFRARTRQ